MGWAKVQSISFIRILSVFICVYLRFNLPHVFAINPCPSVGWFCQSVVEDIAVQSARRTEHVAADIPIVQVE